MIKAQTGPDFSGKIVPEIPEGGQQDVAGNQKCDPGRIKGQECLALSPAHGGPANPRCLVIL